MLTIHEKLNAFLRIVIHPQIHLNYNTGKVYDIDKGFDPSPLP